MDSEAPGRQLPRRAPAPRGQLRWHTGTGSSCRLRSGPCLRAVPSARGGRPSADRPHAHRDPRSRRAAARRDHRRQGHRRRRARTADRGLPRGRSRSPRRRENRRPPVASRPFVGSRRPGAGPSPPTQGDPGLGPQASGPPDVVVPRIGADATVDTLLRYATAGRGPDLRHDPGFASARIPKKSISSALPPAGYDPTCAHSPRCSTRGPSANCAAGCACSAPRPGPRATPTSSPAVSRPGRTCCPTRTPPALNSSSAAWRTRPARLAPRWCRSCPAPATTSYSIPWSASPPSRRSPPSRPAWAAIRPPFWPPG